MPVDNLGYTIRHVISVLSVSYTLSLFTHSFHGNVVQQTPCYNTHQWPHWCTILYDLYYYALKWTATVFLWSSTWILCVTSRDVTCLVTVQAAFGLYVTNIQTRQGVVVMFVKVYERKCNFSRDCARKYITGLFKYWYIIPARLYIIADETFRMAGSKFHGWL
jgi:hypothetical protein